MKLQRGSAKARGRRACSRCNWAQGELALERGGTRPMERAPNETVAQSGRGCTPHCEAHCAAAASASQGCGLRARAGGSAANFDEDACTNGSTRWAVGSWAGGPTDAASARQRWAHQKASLTPSRLMGITISVQACQCKGRPAAPVTASAAARRSRPAAVRQLRIASPGAVDPARSAARRLRTRAHAARAAGAGLTLLLMRTGYACTSTRRT